MGESPKANHISDLEGRMTHEGAVETAETPIEETPTPTESQPDAPTSAPQGDGDDSER